MMNETNELGSTVERNFIVDGDRYRYDFDICSAKKGWQQYDTKQDAWYYGVWVHREKRQILSYVEGDETVVTSPTEEIFQAELKALNAFHGSPPPSAIVYDMEGNRTEVYDEKAMFGREVEGLT